jgi:hypothetical protein
MALLQELLTWDTREANNYREHIREYNSAVAFTSVGMEIELPSGWKWPITVTGYMAR